MANMSVFYDNIFHLNIKALSDIFYCKADSSAV